MFPEGTFSWEAETLAGRKINRESAGVSAEHLDPKSLRVFRLRGRGLPLIAGIVEVAQGIDLSCIRLSGSDLEITTPSCFSKIKFVKRKSFPLQAPGDVKENYLLTLSQGDGEIVIMVEPRGVRVLREEPAAEVN